ncbi:hypothetical protein TPHA_0H00180 [Tetrapisispora phaffii CBS 4417]|uniref:Lon protease homolog, mitochondrial n=1 Tax=Tetrapisispora phaffii (strain ATCC 24235 / CBS 4417 / NBRC 1672 / NRRL Y-8282 / UCD 70-5) TaxID=1071381 RepID=G8BWS5_TETPH|nr:hypothetical protein TPHA_0H00180 [Tetrapisispora phaffii CBS 4417]CCE64229.1 hypothetical protein TPHA_0H00180 [Tetrapisispora phaffii CBS 4417]
MLNARGTRMLSASKWNSKVLARAAFQGSRTTTRYASTTITNGVGTTLNDRNIINNEQSDWEQFQKQSKDYRLQNELKTLETQWLNGLIEKAAKNPPTKNEPLPNEDSTETVEKNEEDIDSDKPVENDSTPVSEPLKNGNATDGKASISSTGGSSSVPPSNNGNDSNGDGDVPNNSATKMNGIPKLYPQMLALPISKRPLFPGFYKAVVISDERVMKVIKEMLERQQPYIGAFMLKDSKLDTDVIDNLDDVYKVGVFAQITSTFPSKDEQTGAETMTALIYPHRRIVIDELIPPNKNVSENTQISKVTDANANTLKKIDTGVDHSTEIHSEMVSDIQSGSVDKKPLDESELVPDEDNDDLDEEVTNPTDFLKNYNVSLVNVSNIEDEVFDRKSPVINALTSEILKVFKEISQLNTMFREQIATFSASIQSATTNIFEEPARLADFAAAVSAGEEKELQLILESSNIEHRLEKSLLILKKELMNAELQNKISKDVETKIQKRQREYYLMEQLKGIKRELGIDNGRDKLIDSFKEKVEKLTLPDAVQKIFDDEITKLSTLETSMSEFGVIRNYLDWIVSLPWGINSKDQYSISSARTILDEDHYGMKDVKDRILEFIAVGKLLGKVNGKIICFVGPPGVGKTSIGKSIARSLNRQFFRFSVGGMTDVAEIKGHRRTYIGALPGRIIQALKKTETQNPLILIDEIDKIGHGGIHGDPSSALLEVLDPEQNSSFLDNYLDIPIDLSKVLFVCTANTLDTIPRPLLDRMEVIELSGYVAEEKIKIVEQYLAPAAKKSAGLEFTDITLTKDAISSLMKHYCRESGVRNLKKHIEKIYRKAALNVVKSLGSAETPSATGNQSAETDNSNKESQVSEKKVNKGKNSQAALEEKPLDVPKEIKIVVDEDNLKDYVGAPVFTTDRIYEQPSPGVIMGLAWTSMGGCSLYVESVLEQPLERCKQSSLERTGQLGDVMKESSRLAYSFAKMHLAQKFPENRFFEKASIHLHCPEGATPKDGPSAGVTMASSFLSLALNKPVEPTIAMTGELTLTGKILRIGGLREKTVAAKRSGAKTVIFPKDNMNDWEELPDYVKDGLTPVAADWYEDVFEVLFPSVTEKEGNEVWKSQFEKIDAKKEKE